MINKKHTQQKTKNDLAKIIRHELGFTNGWWVDEDSYMQHCEKAAKRIISMLKRRKVLKNVAP